MLRVMGSDPAPAHANTVHHNRTTNQRSKQPTKRGTKATREPTKRTKTQQQQQESRAAAKPSDRDQHIQERSYWIGACTCSEKLMQLASWGHIRNTSKHNNELIPQTDLSVGVLAVLVEGRWSSPATGEPSERAKLL